MNNKVFKVSIILTIILTMTISNFILVGSGLISFALDDVSTNNANIEFNSYFKNENGEKTSNLDMPTSNEETSLFLYLNVKKEGYLDGTINLENANFVLKESTSEYVNKVENNKITLNQINAGTTAEIEVKIKFARNETFNLNSLNQESEIRLDGFYHDNSKNGKEIKSTRKVNLRLVSDVKVENVTNDLQIITNKILKVDGEEKRVVQIALKAGLKDNSYPIKSIYSEVTVPIIDGMKPTVEKIIKLNNMTKWNYEYDGELIKVNMSNEHEVWKDAGNEEIILTFIYNKGAEIDETKIKATQKMVLCDETNITANPSEVTIKTNEEKDSIISAEVINSENSIYKGKIYAGVDRTYESETKIDINLVSAVEMAEIREEASTYQPTNIDANIYYSQTKINKKEVENILGEQGSLQIVDKDGDEILTFDSSMEADEDGNIIINYGNEEVKSIGVKITKPEKIGTISLKHTKIIKPVEKGIEKEVNQINTKLVQNYNEYESVEYSKGTQTEKDQIIELKETSTQATISINKSSLSTLTTNNVEINAILKSSQEENDLYKNPKVRIILPKEVVDVKVNSINKLYADEFQVSKAGLQEIPDIGKVLEIDLIGEQKNYLGEISEGIQIVINADITFNKAVPTSKANLIMKYTNENGEQPEYETTKEFSVVSKYGVLVYSKVSGYNKEENILESTSSGNLNAKLDISQNEKVITIERNIINNYDDAIKEIKIVGNLPEIGEEEVNKEKLNSTFIAQIQEVVTNMENAKIYYSEAVNALNESQGWSETVEDMTKVRSYKIELPEKTLQPGEVLKITYKLKIPENITYNESTYEKFDVTYQYHTQTSNENYTTYFSTMVQEEEQQPPVKQEQINEYGSVIVSAISGGKELKDGDEIYEGQTVKETVTLVNDTDKDLNNIKITAKQENGTFYTKKVTQEENTITYDQMDITRIVEDESLDKKEFVVENLKKGDKVSFTYEFSVKEKQGEETKGEIIVEKDGLEPKTFETLTNPIKEAKLKLNTKYAYNEECEILAGSVFSIELVAKNLTENELKNIPLDLFLPNEVKIEENLLEVDGTDYTYIGTENGKASMKINNIAPGEEKSIYIAGIVDDFKEEKKQLTVYCQSILDNQTYISNELVKEAIQNSAKLTIVQTGSVEGDKIETRDGLTYTTTIKNEKDEKQEIQIIDQIPSAVIVQEIYILSGEEKIPVEDIVDNTIDINLTLEANQEVKLVIDTIVDEDLTEEKQFTNVVEINAYSRFITSNEVTYEFIEPQDEDLDNDNTNKDDSNDSDDGESGNTEKNENKGIISGIVWLDENRNGLRENEKTFEGIEVKLLDSITGENVKDSQGKELVTKTDKDGKYKFENIVNGKYIIAIEYDTQKYSVTQYRKTDVDEKLNSDIIEKEVNGKKVAVTDEINIEDNEARNIDAGFIENKIFDLKLDKYINKVILQNEAGTKTTEYNKAKLAKVEIDAKQMKNTTVLVEYSINITNEGEVPGYVNEITDIIPNDFEFNSEINKSWYTVANDKKLHNVSLASELIKPGETKTLTLTLIKTMTENNAGTSFNTAEIAKASNELLIDDIDSIPGNNASNEDDISTAQLILSIRTGLEVVMNIGAVIVVLVGVGLTIYLIMRRGEENE